ncbi:glycoside hydrolase family 88/105 protein [Paenibacillus sp. SYP-B4298]|uniref:glycoside hydrolase family 88/105 protein n=1 Tax=Paenibacillus sp. SYP-B4298 TaxID=2996034 RepID=UPI0022DDB49F|nr:glycoside hydrolase family 88 protein [Paenibacillus sp. SYP-B4298]
MAYIEAQESVFAKTGGRVSEVLETVAGRYIGNHPPHPMTYRAYSKRGIRRQEDYRYVFDLAHRLEDACIGQYIYAWSKLWCEAETELRFALETDSPARLYVNGEPFYRTTLMDENIPDYRATLVIPMRKGWNHLVLRFIYTSTGCGGTFGTATYKSMPLHLLMPSQEREGQEGWIYSEPLTKELAFIPAAGLSEAETGVRWYPDTSWNAQQAAGQGAIMRLYGTAADELEGADREGTTDGDGVMADTDDGMIAYGWTQLRGLGNQPAGVRLAGFAYGPLTVYVDGKAQAEVEEPGPFTVEVKPRASRTDLLLRCVSGQAGWGFELEPLPSGVEQTTPVPVHGAADGWLYLGPLPLEERGPEHDSPADRLCTVYPGLAGGEVFWRLDAPDTWVRIYAENPLFGKWNYPLGVTLYGLLETGAELNRAEYMQYAKRHIELCTSHYRYALWDKEQFGASAVMHTMATLDSLDDCGSFGAVMLLADQRVGIAHCDELAERIAAYISSEQARRPDGMLYRTPDPQRLNVGTAWCDDLYMSVPYLCRYYRVSGDIGYLHDAARQFRLYKETLYIAQQQLMSHVIDYRRGKATEIAWGRGNGWVLFSLSELLAELPQEDSERGWLLAFFVELCEGYLRLQGEHGLWHQVLDDSQSYEEASCTSMFVYSFARAVRLGWIDGTVMGACIQAVERGWEGLCRRAIDRTGNVYGVCRGSGYSYTAAYYRDDLPWLLNDTHGIGIVLLAGMEKERLDRHLAAGRQGGAEQSVVV